MQFLSIVIAENDPALANSLASELDRYFRSVRLARSLEELKTAIPRQDVDAIVANLETVALSDVAALGHELNLPVICTHRVPDEDMWAAALDAGALDMCHNDDVGAIVTALNRNFNAQQRSTAA